MHYELRETFYCDSKSQCTEHLFSPACNASGCGARRERIAALKRASAKAEAELVAAARRMTARSQDIVTSIHKAREAFAESQKDEPRVQHSDWPTEPEPGNPHPESNASLFWPLQSWQLPRF